jgi:hypothetical protein
VIPCTCACMWLCHNHICIYTCMSIVVPLALCAHVMCTCLLLTHYLHSFPFRRSPFNPTFLFIDMNFLCLCMKVIGETSDGTVVHLRGPFLLMVILFIVQVLDPSFLAYRFKFNLVKFAKVSSHKYLYT